MHYPTPKNYITIFIFITMLATAPKVFAGDGSGIYWVSPNGTATWANCESATSLSGTSACALETANQNAIAGDTINLRAGTYNITDIGINPRNSGVSGNRITFSNYNRESVVFDGNDTYNSRGVYISANYITVNGIELLDYHIPIQLNVGSDFNEIENCKIHHSAEGNRNHFNAITLKANCDNNWIHNNTVYEQGPSGCSEGSDGIKIGEPDGVSSNANNNTIENNVIYSFGHSLGADWGFYNVWRNNIGHNNGWKKANLLTGVATGGSTSSLVDSRTDFVSEGIQVGDTVHLSYNATYNGTGTITNVATNTLTFSRVGTINFANGYNYIISKFGCKYVPSGINPDDSEYGHRDFVLGGDSVNGTATHELFEGNRAGYSGTNPNNNGADGITLEAKGSIIRYNKVFGCAGPGVNLKTITVANGSDNLIYSNTFYKNGQSVVNDSSAPHPAVSVYQYSRSAIGNVFKNNIMWDAGSGYNADHPNNGVYMGTIGDQTWGTNICDTDTDGLNCTNSDPLFTDTTMTDMTSLTSPTLDIDASSPAYNTGTYLTQANGSRSNSTSLVVDNASYFQAGSFASTTPMGSSLSNIQADWIAIGTVNNVVQISDINYSTNTITLKSPMTWSDNAKIWLYKNSSGKQVLYGPAPDIGAFEYSAGGALPAPIIDTIR